jgi:two-component system sensor histidine kinase UhpB
VATLAAQATDEAQARAALQALKPPVRTGHLKLEVRAASGEPLLPAAAGAAAQTPAAGLGSAGAPGVPGVPGTGALLALHRRLTDERAPQQVGWTLPRPGGEPWTLTLTADPEAERAEALGSLLTNLALLLAGVAGLLLVLRWNLRRALAPLDRLLQAIERIEQHDDSAVQALPPMPVRELEAVSRALKHLSTAWRAAESERRVLGQRVITLQEDERARLGRELHDEFGQHLTALRADTAWLVRQPLAQGPAAEVLDGMQQHLRHIQQVLRGVLTRLRPLGPGGALLATGEGEAPFTLERLAQLLQTLVDGWHRRAGFALQVTLQLHTLPATAGAPLQPWPADAARHALPQPLVLALYRITQEALTNVARHAGATQARVLLGWQPGVAMLWCVEDDGVGLAGQAGRASELGIGDAFARGSGLAGIRERVWALDADLVCEPSTPMQPRPGLRLQARLPLPPQSPRRP